MSHTDFELRHISYDHTGFILIVLCVEQCFLIGSFLDLDVPKAASCTLIIPLEARDLASCEFGL